MPHQRQGRYGLRSYGAMGDRGTSGHLACRLRQDPNRQQPFRIQVIGDLTDNALGVTV
jgi:hypothetical protein